MCNLPTFFVFKKNNARAGAFGYEKTQYAPLYGLKENLTMHTIRIAFFANEYKKGSKQLLNQDKRYIKYLWQKIFTQKNSAERAQLGIKKPALRRRILSLLALTE